MCGCDGASFIAECTFIDEVLAKHRDCLNCCLDDGLLSSPQLFVTVKKLLSVCAEFALIVLRTLLRMCRGKSVRMSMKSKILSIPSLGMTCSLTAGHQFQVRLILLSWGLWAPRRPSEIQCSSGCTSSLTIQGHPSSIQGVQVELLSLSELPRDGGVGEHGCNRWEEEQTEYVN